MCVCVYLLNHTFSVISSSCFHQIPPANLARSYLPHLIYLRSPTFGGVACGVNGIVHPGSHMQSQSGIMGTVFARCIPSPAFIVFSLSAQFLHSAIVLLSANVKYHWFPQSLVLPSSTILGLQSSIGLPSCTRSSNLLHRCDDTTTSSPVTLVETCHCLMEPADDNVCLTNTGSSSQPGVCTYQPSFGLDSIDHTLGNCKVTCKVVLFLKKIHDTAGHLLEILRQY